MAMLPGAAGINRDRKPEEQVGLLAANKYWLKGYGGTTRRTSGFTGLPVMPWGTFVTLANDIIHEINQRHDHELTQWGEPLDELVPEYTLDGKNWFGPDALALMAPEQRAAVEAFVRQPGFNKSQETFPPGSVGQWEEETHPPPPPQHRDAGRSRICPPAGSVRSAGIHRAGSADFPGAHVLDRPREERPRAQY